MQKAYRSNQLQKSKQLSIAASLILMGIPSFALAALPDPVKAMIETAIASGDDGDINAIVKVAKATNPNDAAEITAMLSEYTERKAQAAAQAKQAKLEAGFFENWTGEGELGGIRSTGNSPTAGISGGIKLSKDAVKWRVKFRALADYRRNRGITSREQYSAVLEPEYKFDDRFYAYGLVQYEKDRFQGFSSRYTLSGGLGYSVIKNQDIVLNIKAGPAWRLTQFTDGGSDRSFAGLLGADLSWQLNKNIKFTQMAGATVASEAEGSASSTAIFSAGTNSFTATSAINAKLVSRLSARLSYSIEHETNPPDGRKKTDTQSRATLVYDF